MISHHLPKHLPHRSLGLGGGVFFLVSVLLLSACQTNKDIRREQEVQKLRSELNQVRTDKGDVDNVAEELKMEVAKTNNLVEERAFQQKQQIEELKREMGNYVSRIAILEAKLQEMENAERNQEREREQKRVVEKARPPTYEQAKKLYDDGRYEEAIDIFKGVLRARSGKPDEAKKSQFFLGESFYASREYASAALEFSEFKKQYPKDTLVPLAIYRQANAFRTVGKPKEAKLFYQELIERFPKNSFAQKAKAEMKRLK